MKLELSEAAVIDLEEIFEYTIREFGRVNATAYLISFDELFVRLSQNPFMGKTRYEIKHSLRSISCKRHVVFYRITSKRIRVIRIIHGSRDYIDMLNRT